MIGPPFLLACLTLAVYGTWPCTASLHLYGILVRHGRVSQHPSSLAKPAVMAHLLQRLYDACKETFLVAAAADGPSPEGLQHVKSLIDALTLSDLGLNEEILSQEDPGIGFSGMLQGWRAAQRAPPIYYRRVHECRSFSVGIFYLPMTAVIPLHDHPGMTVLSKLLYGSMHVKSYDWIDPLVLRPETGAAKARLAKLVMDQVFMAPCESSILYPTSGGNIHVFTGVTHCAVLDVLVPPYSPEEGRPCTYYHESPYSSHSDALAESTNTDVNEQSLSWLEEFQPPDDIVKWVPYEAPKLIL